MTKSRNQKSREDLTAASMHEFYVEPFTEPDGRTTWIVREYVYEQDRYLRQIVSWHETREAAQGERDRRASA